MDQDADEWRTLFRSANQLLRTTTHPAVVKLPVEGRMPLLDNATGWLNSPPLTTARLHGKVVLVDFWTYQLVRQPGPVSERTFEVTFLHTGVEAYAFTFG